MRLGSFNRQTSRTIASLLLLLACAATAAKAQGAKPEQSPQLDISAEDATALSEHWFVGHWVLDSITPQDLNDTDPRGVPRIKVVFDEGGRLAALKHDEHLSADTPYLGWVATKSRLKWVEGTRAMWFIPHFAGKDRMYLTKTYPSLRQNGATLAYRRLPDPPGVDAEVEKVSLQIVKGAGVETDGTPVKLSEDAGLPLPKRLMGTWEVIAVAPKQPPMGDQHPYGYFNDLWKFDASSVEVLSRSANVKAHASWGLSGQELVIAAQGGPRSTWTLSVDNWGHLAADNSEARLEFRHLSRDEAHMPDAPLKVVLVEKP